MSSRAHLLNGNMRCAGACWPLRRSPPARQRPKTAPAPTLALKFWISLSLGAAPPRLGIFEKQYLSVSRLHLKKIGRQNDARSDRTFAIEFLDPGVYAYAFTFG
jgi:hypothetical protein